MDYHFQGSITGGKQYSFSGKIIYLWTFLLNHIHLKIYTNHYMTVEK